MISWTFAGRSEEEETEPALVLAAPSSAITRNRAAPSRVRRVIDETRYRRAT
jgi:hypothetical protein